MTAPRSALRLWHTVRHLRQRQIWSRAHKSLRAALGLGTRTATMPAPRYPGCRWEMRDFPAPGPQQNRADQLLAGRMSFINREATVGWPPTWHQPELPLLWQYNQHYFEWLWALGPEDAATAARDWIRDQPLAPRSVGWAPYPVSLRLMSWLGVFFGTQRQITESQTAFRDELWGSCFRQTQWLMANLETHLLGNHLLENATALAVAGSCFDGPDAGRWLQRAVRLLKTELAEQFLADGMHFERSPMYHLRATYTLLLLSRCGRPELDGLVAEPLSRALVAMQAMKHPDGAIALFNDSAFGIYNTPEELLSAAGAQPDRSEGAWSLPQAGYYGFRDSAAGNYVACDAGAIGPDYLPGHAHGDIFSFELSLGGRRVIVDSGVFEYAPGEMRSYNRSTRAHNTVEIDGQDQCEFWGAFRVARRGKPRDVVWSPGVNGFRLDGWHDGYCRLPGRPIHRRTIEWTHPGRLTLHDRVESALEVASCSRIGLHPDCTVELSEGNARVLHPAGSLSIRFEGAGRLDIERAPYSPEFGRRDERTVLAYFSSGRQAETRITVEQN